MGMVLTAVGTVASNALAGAGGEMGRRTSERLHDLLSRGGPSGEGGPGPASGSEGVDGLTLPLTGPERTATALRLVELTRRSPELAREVMEWAEDAAWLAPRAVPAVAHGASRPRMLPPASAAFTDREDVLQWIAELMDEGDRPPGSSAVAVLVGPGGIGKTEAVVHSAHALGERFPHGTLHVDLRGASAATALEPSDVLARFLERLGVPSATVPGDEDRQCDLYRDCMADRRMIVVLDNAHDDTQVLPLLPASPGSLVLVTSRHRLPRLVALGARRRTLRPLSLTDSVALLERVSGRELPDGQGAEAVRAVAEATGGVPLALCTTGSGLAEREHLTWERMAQQLSHRLDGRDRGGDAVHDPGHDSADPVRLAHDASYAELGPECAALYRAIAVWDWPTVTVACAAHSVGVSEEEARELLERLARVHLLEEVGEERYRFHDLTRAHARQLAIAEDGPARSAAVVRRVAVAQLRRTAAADFRVMPKRWRVGPAYRGLRLAQDRDPADGRHALNELLLERENTAAVIRAAAHHGFDELVWQLCEAMWALHLRLGFHAQWTETHLLGAESARRCAAEFGDPRAPGRVLVQLAFGHMGAGRADDAERALTEAVAAERACGHHRGEASAVEALGLLRLKQWRYAQAERCFEEAGEILDRIRDGDAGREDVPRAKALLAHHIGRAQSRQRRFEDALTGLNDALARLRRLPDGGDPYNEGRVYMSLGEAHLDAGDTELAAVCLDKALGIMEAEGAGLQLADAAELRARCHRLAGRPAEEAADLRVAARHYERHDDRTGLERVRARLDRLEP